MHKGKLGLLVGLIIFLTACGTSIPPTVVVMVVTPTPDANVVQVTITPSGAAPATQQAVSGGGAVALGTQQATPTPVVLKATANKAPTATFGPTQTLSPFPTETRGQLYIAQEDFQNGYMFWISTKKVIWVLYKSSDPNQGTWQSFDDTFVDGEPEIDPSLTPPQGLYQPKRGFGKIWRNTAGMRDKMGWATTPEFDLQTHYVYQPGGYLDNNNVYVARPGTHFVETLSRQTFALAEPQSSDTLGTWKKVG